jgi:2-methylcitrate dehydratase PrpD
MGSLTETIGTFIADTDFAAIPPPVVERTKVSLVHNLAMAMAGRSRERVAHVMAKRFWPVPAEATLLHDGARVSIEAAAFANGALIHARSQDDTHAGSTSHPGGAVMPAALAVAQAEGRGGPEFLAAVILGYEALGRIGRDFDEMITARGFRAAAVVGGFGAAAAAAKLMRLSGPQTAHALGLVAHLAGGLSQVWREGSAEGPLQLGFAARNGVLAARAAQAGATAAHDILEGSGGFYRAYAGADAHPVEALANLGTSWQMPEVTVKPYPVCAILQGPVDAMLRLARRHDVDPPAVSRIAVALNPYEAAYPGIDNAGPFASATATKMSAQFSLALALADRRMTMDDLFRWGDERICALARRVSVIGEPAIAARTSRLRVELTDGRILQEAVDTAVGQPSFTEISDFARGLSQETGLAVGVFDDMIEAVTALERAPDLCRLTESATRGV